MSFHSISSNQAVRPSAEVQREQTYIELERRYRGTEEEIAERISVYLPHLEGKGEILDLGCGGGFMSEALARRAETLARVGAADKLKTPVRALSTAAVLVSPSRPCFEAQ